MKVLHVLHTYPPDSSGGIETYVRSLCGLQRAAAWEPSVFAGRDWGGERPEIHSVDDVPIVRLPAPHRADVGLDGRDAYATHAFEVLLKDEPFDVVHLHHWHNVSSDIVAAAHRAGAGTVVTLHDYFAFCPLFFRLRNERLCDADVTPPTCAECIAPLLGDTRPSLVEDLDGRNRRFREELTRAGAVLALSHDQAESLRAIPAVHGIDIRTLPLPGAARPRRELAPWTPSGRLRIVTWGGLVPGKGLHVLVAARARTRDPGRITIDHFGRIIDSAYADDLLARAGTGLSLHGAYGDDTDRAAFAAFDLMVFPSLYRETHGYVVDEALQLGLPVVVPDRGAPRERIGTRGSTFRAGDPDSLARVLDRFLEEPEALARLRAGTTPARPTPDDHWHALERVYRDVLRPSP